MAQLDFYALAKRYYKRFYSNEDVGVFVQAKKITPEQYKEITNFDYVEQQQLIQKAVDELIIISIQ